MPLDLSSILDTSHFATFLGGAVVGSAGQYLADRFTDQRRKKENISSIESTFNSLKSDMENLFKEMADDLRGDESKSIREFVVCPNKRINFSGDKPRFIYYEEEHPYLKPYVDRLESAGYIVDVTPGSAPIFRMSELFVELLRKDA